MNEKIYSQTELRQMVSPLLKKYSASYALLFGSYARGEATGKSDIDLVIVGDGGFKPFDVFAIAEELHEHSGKPVDVYELGEIRPNSPFYHQVMAESVRLQ